MPHGIEQNQQKQTVKTNYKYTVKMDDYISYLNKVIPEKDSLKIVKSKT